MMTKKDEILQAYFLLKDCLEDDDDFSKMHDLIKSMSEIDAKAAFDMWYPLLSQYEDYVSANRYYDGYYFISLNLAALGDALGSSTLDQIILSDGYLYELLFKKYHLAGSPSDYTHEMILRALSQSNIALADQMFGDIYSIGNRYKTWFEIMDGFFFYIKFYNLNMGDTAKKLLVKWAAKMTDKKDRAKIMSSILAAGQDFDLSPFMNSEMIPESSHVGKDTDDFADCTDLLSELLCSHPQSLSDRQILKSLLLDYFPQKKLIVNSLLMAYDEGMTDEITSSDEIDFLAEQRMRRVLMNNYGISADLSNGIISTWIQAIKQSKQTKENN